MLPHQANGAAAQGFFNAPSARFGFRFGGDYTVDTLNSTRDDILRGCAEDCGHHTRAWPARDQNGELIPNTYLLCADSGGANLDYEDVLYLVTNVKPGGDTP